MKLNADVKQMTRAQGERAVAATNDPEVLQALGDHKNKHVRAKAAYKYERVAPPAPPMPPAVEAPTQ